MGKVEIESKKAFKEGPLMLLGAFFKSSSTGNMYIQFLMPESPETHEKTGATTGTRIVCTYIAYIKQRNARVFVHYQSPNGNDHKEALEQSCGVLEVHSLRSHILLPAAKMGGRIKFQSIIWVSLLMIGDVITQYRNISTTPNSDPIQAFLARYLQRRLQGRQLSTPPPPSVLFASNQHRTRTHQASRRHNDLSTLWTLEENQEKHKKYHRDEYDDYEHDLEGFEDSDRSRTRIDLLADDCPNCVDDHANGLGVPPRWTMPLLKLGEKRYYLGIFFKANWYRAAQYCRYHGMHLASIASQEENDRLEKHIKDFGLGHEHFWTSGTDQAEEGTFFWMANGRPITFENWNVGEPNNFRYENGEEEHCLELWNRDGKGLKWNDSPCSFETFFVCEVQ
ncbi:uncharacterized protein [Chelonus insularis]|uniref:uncharacterized protein n=1 Tax=Chelonus insularis TaxID=460826 RepID=UPI00158B7811|nr:uncharacterized protein LOC118069846 [Chelonus insularis]XP_034944081.1 uncharacterized protein LOC118069846 [Chelonus insularis]